MQLKIKTVCESQWADHPKKQKEKSGDQNPLK